MKYKKKITTVLLLFLLLSIISCAPAGPTDYEYSFFGGVWHGMTITFSGIGYWFSSNIGYTAVTNSGFLYYSGYVIGILLSIPVDLLLAFCSFYILLGLISVFKFFKKFIAK